MLHFNSWRNLVSINHARCPRRRRARTTRCIDLFAPRSFPASDMALRYTRRHALASFPITEQKEVAEIYAFRYRRGCYGEIYYRLSQLRISRCACTSRTSLEIGHLGYSRFSLDISLSGSRREHYRALMPKSAIFTRPPLPLSLPGIYTYTYIFALCECFLRDYFDLGSDWFTVDPSM